tara:strand:+ start:379 stop:1695 length:1317 start_codon:yes stop_codon:yes gene_type:complete
MDINSQYIHKEMGAALPVTEHVLIIDPTSRSTAIKGGEQTTFDIPTASGANGSFIDMNSSYISFKLSAEGTTGAVVTAKKARLSKAGIHGLFGTIDVESSGYTVEHTTDYAQLHSVLSDISGVTEDRSGYTALAEGLAVAAYTTPAALNQGCDLPITVVNPPDKSGDLRFTCPIPSQCLNSGSHLPVHAISQLRYRITWAKAAEGVVSGVADADCVNFRIEEPKLHLCYLEMSSASRSVITQKSKGLSWSLPMWETHRANLSDGLGSTTFRIPSHKSSIKTLLTTFQDSTGATSGANSTKLNADCLSRDFPNVENFQYRLNGQFYPQQEVECTGGATTAAIELMRAFHKTKAQSGMITRDNFTKKANLAAGGKFAIATNVESNQGRSNSSFAGVSTLQEAPLLTLKFDVNKSNPQTVFNYVQYDTNHSIVNGIWKVDM